MDFSRNFIKFSTFIPAVGGYVVLVWLFSKALINPSGNIDFITQVGFLIYMIEFLSIHASGMFSGTRAKESSKLIEAMIYLGYVTFAIGAGIAFKTFVMPAIFLLSTTSKLLAKQSLNGTDQKRLAFFVINLIATTAIVVVFQSFIVKLFPFPATLTNPGSKALFDEFPQTLMAWGVLYYGIDCIFEINLFARSLKLTQQNA